MKIFWCFFGVGIKIIIKSNFRYWFLFFFQTKSLIKISSVKFIKNLIRDFPIKTPHKIQRFHRFVAPAIVLYFSTSKYFSFVLEPKIAVASSAMSSRNKRINPSGTVVLLPGLSQHFSASRGSQDWKLSFFFFFLLPETIPRFPPESRTCWACCWWCHL